MKRIPPFLNGTRIRGGRRVIAATFQSSADMTKRIPPFLPEGGASSPPYTQPINVAPILVHSYLICKTAYMNKHLKPSGRKHPVHLAVFEKANQSSIIFVTVCAKDRKSIFAMPEVHELIVRSWLKANYWTVGRYVIMPDHIHFFCSPATHDFPPLTKWIQYWKALVSREWPDPNEQPIWQQDFWDTQLRQGDSYGEKWHYVRDNPVRAGLAEKAEDWPFQGELEALFWHD